jgi:pyruvate/2-oxoacid:ferredoxin oxidoreductase alpha subunit
MRTADYFFVTFGSTTEPAIEAIDILKSQGKNFGLVSFSYLCRLTRTGQGRC